MQPPFRSRRRVLARSSPTSQGMSRRSLRGSLHSTLLVTIAKGVQVLDYDLHCHSNVSDGTLTPTELVARAAGRGVKVLALTDHDDVDGLAEAAQAAAAKGIEFIKGVEISVTWRKHTVHVVGLRIDPNHPALV